ncbi:MAG: glycosyltransferase family 39 protein [Anaerolineae bacterium]
MIILLAFGLRVHRLGFQELRGDEAFGYFFSQQSFGEIVQATLALREPHPVTGYFIEKAWLALAGDSEFALRFVSAWWGVLAVAFALRLGHRLALGPAPSALAALLLATSPYAVWHSQDARMYTMSLALTLASSWLALVAVGRGRWRNWAAYVAVSWLALQTHYFAAFVILAQNLFIIPAMLFIRRRPRKALAWAGAQLTVGLLTLPWIILARDTLLSYGGNGDSPAFGSMLMRALSAFAVGETSPTEQRLFWAVLAGLLVAIGIARLLSAGPGQREGAGFLAFHLFLPLLVTWASALSRPIFNERYLMAAVPPFYLLLASAIFVAPMRRYGLALTADVPAIRACGLTPKQLLVIFAAVALLVLQTGAVLSLQRYFTDPPIAKLLAGES